MMKLMNSETHSWTFSLASFEILALVGSALFMIRLMLAMGRNCSCSFDEKLSEMFPGVGLPTELVWFLLFDMLKRELKLLEMEV